MNFNQLKYIVAVDRQRNFSRAAEDCGVAQSTMSKEIQKLEKEFNIIIFDRSRFPVKPTMKGEDLIVQAKKILKEHDKFKDIARQMTNRPKGEFRLGILPTLAPYLLPLFINSLSKKYPELNLQILEFTSEEMLTHFEKGDLHGAITIAPFIKEGFYEEFLFEEKFNLYVGTQHPLAKKKKVRWSEVPLDELLLHDSFKRFLLSSDELKTRVEGSTHSLSNIDYQSGSLETIRKIIDRNGGLTLLPSLSSLYMGNRRLKMVRPIIEPVLTRKVCLVTPRGFEKKRITKVIKKEILQDLPEH